MSRHTLIASLAALAAVSTPAWAHHSFAMFDAEKTVTMAGTVTEFTWGNPHTWIKIVSADGAKTLGVECGSPNMMIRQGWKSSLIKPGDKVSVKVHPMKDGSPTGSLIAITLADGRELGPGGPPPPQ